MANETLKRAYTVTNPNERANHKVTVRLPYLCSCGKEFKSYNEWLKHRTTESAIRRKTDE